ncbi:hypothetical protein QTP88_004814 [Uroleucon formosanum]
MSEERQGVSRINQRATDQHPQKDTNQKNSKNLCFHCIEINNKILGMEIDSGAARSVLTESISKEKWPSMKFNKVDTKLNFIDGTSLKPIGEFNARVKFKDKSVEIKLLVVKSSLNYYSLFGRDLMKLFNISLVQIGKNINIVESVKNEKVHQLLNKFKDIFDNKLGEYKNFEIHLELNSDVNPIFCKNRTIPFAYKLAGEKELDKLEKAGIIKKSEDCQWGTPLVPVLKPNGEIRLCTDYKTTINKHIKDVHYPFPKIKELFESVQGSEKFSKLDFKNAYNQLKVDSQTSKLLAWSTHKGVYEVLRLPYGVKPATAIFQKEIEKVFKNCPFTANLLDDLIVTGRNDSEHLENLKEVFKRFPKNVSEIKSFLGMINYYGKFIKNLSTFLAPLHNLLKKETPFIWSDQCSSAFTKTQLRDLLVMHRVLSSAEKNYSVIHKEALAIIWGITKFFQYLKGRHFIIRSDHKPLIPLLGENNPISKMASGRLQRWAFFLSGFDYQIEYIKGSTNTIADSLSRLPCQDNKDELLNWPSIDLDIERAAKSCTLCLESKPEPQKCFLTKWPKSLHVIERIHLDYLGPINNKMFLIIIDSYSNWPEVFEVDNADTFDTLEKLKETFARFGLPDTIVSDNGTPFTSNDFSKFCEINGIKNLTSPPFHPTSNSTAENAIKNFKLSFKKIIKESKISVHSAIQKYLFFYRNSEHSTIGYTPSNLMFKRNVRTRFDRITNMDKSIDKAITRAFRNYKGKVNNKKFEIGENVYIRDYSKSNKKNWKACIIDEQLGLNKKVNDNDNKQRNCDKEIIIIPQEEGDENVVVSLEINEKGNDEEAHMQSEIKVPEVIENKYTRSKRNTVKPNKFKDYVSHKSIVALSN